MLVKFLYIILLLNSINLAAEKAKVDSLISLLDKYEDINRIVILDQIVDALMPVSPSRSLAYAKEGLSIAEKLNINTKQIKFLSSLGLGFRLTGAYNQSLERYLKALDLAETLKDKLIIADIKNSIGNVYNYIGNLDKALTYYNESLQIREKENDTLDIAKSLNNIGNIYKSKGEFPEALNTLFRSLHLKQLMSDSNGVVTTQKNIGGVYTETGEIDSALYYFDKAIKTESSIGDTLGVINSLILISNAYYEGNSLHQAKRNALRALEMSKRTDTPYYIMRSNYILYQISEKESNYKNALMYIEDYLKARNKIFDEERHKQSLEIEAAYNLREKEKLVHDLELNKKTLQSNIFVIISLVAIASVIVFIIIYRDRIKRADQLRIKNEELRKAIERSEKANHMKSDFLAQMSHEIRTPINTILNYTSLLRMEFEHKLTGDLEGSFNSIEKAATRLLRTIDLVLNMSDIESGTYDAIPQKLYVYSDIMQPIYSEFLNSVKSKGLIFNIINELQNDPQVIVDGYTISQIMANLVDNAIKYTAAGSIVLRLYSINKRPAVDVSDTGIGISSEYIPKLFTKFSQEEQGYTRKFEGTGLGLSLVKKYCEINNCDISVKSKKGEGTTFTILFNHSEN